MRDDRPIYLEPAASVLTILGEATCAPTKGPKPTVIGRGVKLAQQVTGRNISRVYRWLYPKEKRGYGGHIPYEDAEKLLAYARKHEIPLGPEHFFAEAPR